jgi:hypothetical protein
VHRSLCRPSPQEAAYNIARAAHHLNLLHIALPFYERVLETPPPAARPGLAAAAPARPPRPQGQAPAAGLAAGSSGGAGEALPDSAAAAAAAAVAGEGGEGGEGGAVPRAGAPVPQLSKYDLRREAAYNLSLIYRSSGADELAREVLRTHLSL